MFIVLMHYPDPAATKPYRDAHLAFVRRHVESGHFLLSGPQEPRVGGATIVRADSRADVEAIMAQEPYTAAGVADYEIVQFVAVMGVLYDLLETARSSSAVPDGNVRAATTEVG